MDEEKAELLDFAVKTALDAGTILTAFWGKLKGIQKKLHSSDLVTEADREAEKCIFNAIQKQYPDHAFLGEETGFWKKKEGDCLWIVDPLDGTTNFAHQYPTVAVSICLLVKGDPTIAVVYNPILDELFTGIKGHGSFFRHQALRVSKINSLEDSLLATGFPYDRLTNPDNNYAEFCHLTQLSQGVRRGGSAALDLAYVAAGRLDGYWEKGIKSWDVAAGALLVLEAGGQLTSYQSAFDLYDGSIIATNGNIHASLEQELVLAKKQSGEIFKN